MLDVFILSLEKHIKVCENAFTTQNTPELIGSIHDVKSLSYTLGANEEGDLAKSIEHSLHSEEIKSGYEKIPTMINNLKHIVSTLKEER